MLVSSPSGWYTLKEDNSVKKKEKEEKEESCMETSYRSRLSVKKIPFICFWLLIALLSLLLLRPWVSSAETYTGLVESLDGKKATVTELVVASTAASAAISLLPDDTATPIAEQITKLGGFLGIVLAVLYLEKYLLPILGLLSSVILIPAACLFFVGHGLKAGSGWKKRIGILLLVCAMACLLVIPTGVWVSDRIEENFKTSIDSTMNAALQAADFPADTEEENASLWRNITNAAQNTVNWAKQVLNIFIEAVVIMVVTNCVIPVLTLLFFVALVKQVAGIVKYSALPGYAPERYLDD